VSADGKLSPGTEVSLGDNVELVRVEDVRLELPHDSPDLWELVHQGVDAAEELAPGALRGHGHGYTQILQFQVYTFRGRANAKGGNVGGQVADEFDEGSPGAERAHGWSQENYPHRSGNTFFNFLKKLVELFGDLILQGLSCRGRIFKWAKHRRRTADLRLFEVKK
jgi:hypothetical protein